MIQYLVLLGSPPTVRRGVVAESNLSSPAREGVRAVLKDLVELFKAIAMVYKYRAEMYKALADYNRSKRVSV